ncbi:MAG: C13 family peptidase [Nanoarchaeota archaeon]|nr:C13 family peptidase [Nanoarchaeota archaeon]
MKLANRLGLLAMISALGGACTTSVRFEPNSANEFAPPITAFQDKYALVVIGSTNIGNYYGFSEQDNPFNASGRGVYNELKMLGFKDENMKFISGETASARKVEDAADEFAQKVDNNDLFVAYIGTHGSPFALMFDNDGRESFTTTEIERAFEKVNPKLGVLYLDSCYSGNVISDLELPRYVLVSSTGKHSYSFSDTFFSPGISFFSQFSDSSADLNHDGHVTIAEAFAKSNEDTLAYQQERISAGSEMAARAGFEQMMYVGSQASPYYYLADVGGWRE